jgi:hypothetical protein
MALAQNWRRRGMFDEVKFIFPNAPSIPITVVRQSHREWIKHIAYRERANNSPEHGHEHAWLVRHLQPRQRRESHPIQQTTISPHEVSLT